MSDDSNLYKRDGIWYTRVWIDGRDVRRSLRTGDKRIARRERDRLMERTEAARRGEERHTWKEAVVGWAAWAPGNLKPATLKRYKVSLRQLRPHLDDTYVDEINRAKVKAIEKSRRAQGASNATIRRDLTAMSSVLEYCESEDWLERNVAREHFRFVKEKTPPRPLPADGDIDFVVSLAPAAFARLIRFAQFTGMRQEEIGGLERPQVKGKRVDLWKTKTSTPRSIDLDDRAFGTISGTPVHLKCPFVFWHSEGERFSGISSQFRGIMARAVREAKKRGITFRPFTFHDLRHWYAVDYLRQPGRIIYDLQKILGHTSIKTTERYLAYLTPDEQERAKYGSAQNPAQGSTV